MRASAIAPFLADDIAPKVRLWVSACDVASCLRETAISDKNARNSRPNLIKNTRRKSGRGRAIYIMYRHISFFLKKKWMVASPFNFSSWFCRVFTSWVRSVQTLKLHVPPLFIVGYANLDVEKLGYFTLIWHRLMIIKSCFYRESGNVVMGAFEKRGIFREETPNIDLACHEM